MGRRRIPKPTKRKNSLTYEVRFRLGSKIVSRSLRTRDYDTALRRIPEAFDKLMSEHESAILGGSMPPALRQSAKRILTTDEACQAYSYGVVSMELAARSLAKESSARLDPASAAKQAHARAHQALEAARSRALLSDFTHQERYLDHLEGEIGGAVPNRETAVRAMAQAGVAAWQELIEQDLSWLGGAATAPNGSVAAYRQPFAPNPPSTPVLSEILQKYLKYREGALATEVRNDHYAVIRDFCGVRGDRQISSYDKNDVRQFKEVLLALPANWTKLKPLRGLSITDAAKKAEELGFEKMKPQTIERRRGILRSVFQFAADNYEGVRNPFEGGGTWKSGTTAGANQRDAFTGDELRTLLSSDLPKELYWLTWLALYTGARLNELCQLSSSNVRNASGVPFIYFDPSMKLKTNKRGGSSVRSVPLHHKLIELGFLAYAAEQMGPLFPALRERSDTGRLSHAPSRAFARHMKRLNLKRPELSFHSLRHTFVAELKRRAPTEIENRERLLGHTIKGVAGSYGATYASEAQDIELLKHRAEVVARLTFE